MTHVIISLRARRAAERIDTYWREHADHPRLFSEELRDAIEFLATAPSPGMPFPTERRPRLMRVLLPKTRCHVYFEVEDDVVLVLHIWHAQRERPPKL